MTNPASETSMQNWQKRLDSVRNKADVIIAKNRHGKPETVHLSFTGEYYLFDNLNQFGSRPMPDSEFDNQYAQPSDNNVQTVADINDIPDDMI